MIESWGEVAPSLVDARKIASETAKKAGITYRDGEDSAIYKEVLVKEMGKRGFNGKYEDYKNAWDDYSGESAITSFVSKPIQKKVLKKMGLSVPPKTKDVKQRIEAYTEAANIYLQTEKKAFKWIGLKDRKSRRLIYERGTFKQL